MSFSAWRTQARSRRLLQAAPVVPTPSSAVAGTLHLPHAQEALELDALADELGIDALARLGAHPPGDMRGLVAAEACRSAALVTVPIGSTLALLTTGGPGGDVTVLGPADLPRNVAKALEGGWVGGCVDRGGAVGFAGFGAHGGLMPPGGRLLDEHAALSLASANQCVACRGSLWLPAVA